jgi:hypothetical protein
LVAKLDEFGEVGVLVSQDFDDYGVLIPGTDASIDEGASTGVEFLCDLIAGQVYDRIHCLNTSFFLSIF